MISSRIFVLNDILISNLMPVLAIIINFLMRLKNLGVVFIEDIRYGLQISYLSNHQENGSYISNVNIISKLWEQLDKDTDSRIHNRILCIMLDSLLEDGHNGLIGQISNSAVVFLRTNKKYAMCFFRTILKIAEDEMNHQKYNAEYIKKNRDEEDYEFIPNMVPKLRGVDYYISESEAQSYESNKELIIQTYLFKECEVDVDHFDIDNYDIGIMCHIPRCGLNLEDENFVKIVKEISFT